MATKTKKVKEKKVRKETHRILYDVWINSQLSIIRFYGAGIIHGKRYELDYENCKTVGEGEDKKYFPDLVCYE